MSDNPEFSKYFTPKSGSLELSQSPDKAAQPGFSDLTKSPEDFLVTIENMSKIKEPWKAFSKEAEERMKEVFSLGIIDNQDALYANLREKVSAELIIYTLILFYGGEENAKEIIEKTQSLLGSAYVRLLIEPSIGNRSDEFLEFAQRWKQERNSLPSPEELREEFKKSLGMMRIFRAGAFTAEGIEGIKKNGFASAIVRNKAVNFTKYNQGILLYHKITNIRGNIVAHAHGSSSEDENLLISVSQVSEIAQSGAMIYLENTKKWKDLHRKGHELYLVPMDIEKFYCLGYSKYIRAMGQSSFINLRTGERWKGDDDRIENFVQFNIPSEKIDKEHIRKVDVSTMERWDFED
jgi:hypothetical protein